MVIVMVITNSNSNGNGNGNGNGIGFAISFCHFYSHCGLTTRAGEVTVFSELIDLSF
eukprot:Pgem_evm1s1405